MGPVRTFILDGAWLRPIQRRFSKLSKVTYAKRKLLTKRQSFIIIEKTYHRYFEIQS